MTETYWTFLDKTGWGVGPWVSEPDKVQFTDPATGLPCLIVRNRLGALCGYVGVAPGHPAYGRDYTDELVSGLRVHGGLTFADRCQPVGVGHGGAARDRELLRSGARVLPGVDVDEWRVCHVPAPGEPDDVHWFGFDCAHAWDLVPGMNALSRRMGGLYATTAREEREVYLDLAYVRGECRDLAAQLARIASGVREEDDGG